MIELLHRFLVHLFTLPDDLERVEEWLDQGISHEEIMRRLTDV